MQKYRIEKSYVSWHWRVMQGLKKNWLLVPKMTWGIWWILKWAVASLKICTFMYYFCRKYIMLEPKKYKGVMCHNINKWCKIWKETGLYFEKKDEDLVNFDPAFKSLTICTLMGSFWPKNIMFELKKYEEVMCNYTEDRCKLVSKNYLYVFVQGR